MLTAEEQEIQRLKDKFWKYVHLPWEPQDEDCWWWIGAKIGPYGTMVIRGRRYEYAHRLAYRLFKGPIPDGLLVCHKCDVPSCVNHHHLFLGTDKDNTDDSIAKGRNPYKNRDTNPLTLIKSDRLPEVFRLRREGLLYKQIAIKMGVREETIGDIIRDERNAHLK